MDWHSKKHFVKIFTLEEIINILENWITVDKDKTIGLFKSKLHPIYVSFSKIQSYYYLFPCFTFYVG